jgi:hypothetical protein
MGVNQTGGEFTTEIWLTAELELHLKQLHLFLTLHADATD